MSVDIDVKNLLKQVIDNLISEYKPRKIILFGSYACKEHTDDSDIDLLVVIDDTSNFKSRHKLIDDFSIPIHLIFISNEEFIETKDVIGGIAYPAFKDGEIIYEES